MLRRSAAAVGFVGALLFAPFVSGFGLTVSGSSYVIDTSGGLIFTGTFDSASGDITSLKYNGVETQGTGKHSHISSGIGAKCTYKQTGNNNNYIVITCTTSTLTHYYVAQYKTPAVWMATYTTAEPTIGELRYIARLKASVISSGPKVSNVAGGSAVEAGDVFNVGGQTRSKFYSGVQFINDQVHGATGSGIGVYMVIPGTGYEGSSGGPFHKDINNQNGGDQEVYFYMNSGHTQTESFRQGLHGPYALWYTTGAAPASNPDTSFFDDLDIKGYVPKSGRGRVIGKAVDVPTAFNSEITIGWSNSAAQYWATVDASTLNFASPYMKPGTYTQTLYKRELAVGTASVTVTAGGTTTLNSHDTYALDTLKPIWTIGEFDGTPTGFLNANLFTDMHPSDSRMNKWGPITYTVGSPIIQFPMAIFKAIGPLTIKTTLTSSQIGARTLRIGTTLAFAGGRPTVVVNSWTGKSPAAPTQPDSRGVTRGTYRGNNILYEYAIPSGVLVAGSNTITITIISGSSGEQFLSPNVVLDAVALY